MEHGNNLKLLQKYRLEIAEKTRELRRRRGWTQADLAKLLALSQNRLSEIERGGGSFTAEQFLLLQKLFNVATSEFVAEPRDRHLEIQNALARLGAAQLHENTRGLPSHELEDVHDVVREALLLGTPRLVTAIAPVLVAHAERLNLSKLYADLKKLGHEDRLSWVVESTLVAVDILACGSDPEARAWSKLRLRMEVPFKLFVEFAAHNRAADARGPLDVLDAAIRSRRTLEEVQRHQSKLAVRWGVVTSLQPEDFVHALEASRAAAA